MTNDQLQALREISLAIIDAVKQAGPLGAPAGPMYAALMAQGCTLTQFEGIMRGLVKAGFLTQSGNCYHACKEMRAA